MTAGLVIALAADNPPLDGLRLGAAMAAARLGHLEATLHAPDVADLERAVEVRPID